MSFLDKILETKRLEVAALHQSGATFEPRKYPIHSLKKALLGTDQLSVISEIKRKSPSKGMIQANVNPVTRAQVYERAGAAAVSVLTDRDYFSGSIDDLKAVRAAIHIPILRKDFIIDEIQVDEAHAAGADAILLIAAAMPSRRLSELSSYAQRLGLDVLLEVHGVHELDMALAANPSVIGINNRDLHTFQVDLGHSEEVLRNLPKDVVAIAESGIFGVDDAKRMANAGAAGILVGELLMRHEHLDDVSKSLQTLQVPTSQGTDAHV